MLEPPNTDHFQKCLLHETTNLKNLSKKHGYYGHMHLTLFSLDGIYYSITTIYETIIICRLLIFYLGYMNILPWWDRIVLDGCE